MAGRSDSGCGNRAVHRARRRGRREPAVCGIHIEHGRYPDLQLTIPARGGDRGTPSAALVSGLYFDYALTRSGEAPIEEAGSVPLSCPASGCETSDLRALADTDGTANSTTARSFAAAQARSEMSCACQARREDGQARIAGARSSRAEPVNRDTSIPFPPAVDEPSTAARPGYRWKGVLREAYTTNIGRRAAGGCRCRHSIVVTLARVNGGPRAGCHRRTCTSHKAAAW